MATSVPLGIVSLKAEGAYAADKLYKKGMWVTSSGSSYAYINPTPAAGVPVTDTSHWQQIASRGMTGPSAYDAAVAGEYTGTEAEFNAANAGIEAARDAALDAAETANDAAENAETAAYRSMLWRKTASGNPVSVYPVPESPLYPKVSGTSTQEGTGDPSPENIRQITPWLASGGTVKVKRTGKNLLNIDASAVELGTFDQATGIPIAGSTRQQRTKQYVLLNAGNIVLSNPAGHNGRAFFYDLNFNYIGTALMTSGVAVSVASRCYARFVSGASGFTGSGDSPDWWQIELGSTATPYEPYTESEITLTAPQEIPAGWMGNEGNGQVTGVKATLNGSETWNDANFAASGYFETTLSVAAHATPGLACSHFLPAASAAADSNKVVISGTSLKIYPADAVATDKTAWLAYLAANPVAIAYTRATPVSITPASAPLPALPQFDRVTPRQNVLTASTGYVELTYAKSPIREADELAAAIAALP